ncbi:MAG: O-antigen ligase family protein [Deltaproteobacteria bacterium]|nr:O-antigen ligase family protein [Deltaproteobacteria bacterium]
MKGDTLLYVVFVLVFFSMSLGTTPVTIFGILSLFVWLFAGKIKGFKFIVKNSWFWPVLVLMVLPWVGLLYTPDLSGVGIDYAAKSHYWLYAITVASIFFAIFPSERLIQAFLAGLALNAVVAIYQFAGFVPLTRGYEYRGFGEGYGVLSVFLIVGILIASYYFGKAAEKKRKVLLSFLIMLYFFHLIIMQGRAGYVTFALLSPFIVHTLFRKLGFVKILLACICLLSLMAFSPVVRERVRLSISQLEHHVHEEGDGAWGKKYSKHQDRFFMWYGAIPIFLENPLLGVGTGGYQTAMKQRGKPGDPDMAHPHNNILHMAVSYGIVGIIAYFWLFVETLRNAWQQRETPVGFFVLSTAIVVFVSGLFNTTIIDVGTLFLLAVAVGLQQAFPKFVSADDTQVGKESSPQVGHA